jgi:hypothetical protein
MTAKTLEQVAADTTARGNTTCPCGLKVKDHTRRCGGTPRHA